MMGSVDNEILVWLPVENNSCSICISHEITTTWSIIKLLSCNTSIDDVDSHTPYFDVFNDSIVSFQRSKEQHHAIYSHVSRRAI